MTIAQVDKLLDRARRAPKTAQSVASIERLTKIRNALASRRGNMSGMGALGLDNHLLLALGALGLLWAFTRR